MVVFVLGGGEGLGETGARLCVGLLVDRAQVALYHAHRDAELLGDLLERAFVLGYGHEHVDFARGESVIGDEGLTLLLDGGGRRVLLLPAARARAPVQFGAGETGRLPRMLRRRRRAKRAHRS